MSLSRYQLERTDIIAEIEQGRRVEAELFRESHRKMETMGELLKARMFGSTEYAIGLRKRMTKFQGGAEVRGQADPALTTPPEPHDFPCQDPYCDRCNDAIKRLFRDIGVLPSGKPVWGDLAGDPFTGRLTVPSRYRKDESDV